MLDEPGVQSVLANCDSRAKQDESVSMRGRLNPRRKHARASVVSELISLPSIGGIGFGAISKWPAYILGYLATSWSHSYVNPFPILLLD